MSETAITRVSIEPSRRCSKGCAFCYNGSSLEGAGSWTTAALIGFARDLARHGVTSLSIGGGEPLEWDGLFDTLAALRGAMLRSFTTNGLPLEDAATFERAVAASPDKIHVSIHEARSQREIARAARLASALAERGVPSGVNLLVRRSALAAARDAALALHAAGIGNERIVFLPMRGHDTPSADEVAQVAGGPFQSMTCLRACGISPRFVSVAADRTVAWCSYTRERRPLRENTHAGLVGALAGLGLAPCDGDQLVRLDAGGAQR